jgi:ketosteroid isomerase-like protein
MTVHDLFGGGDRFAVTYTWEVAAPDGTWSGSPGCAIVHVRDGQIALWREYKG